MFGAIVWIGGILLFAAGALALWQHVAAQLSQALVR